MDGWVDGDIFDDPYIARGRVEGEILPSQGWWCVGHHPAAVMSNTHPLKYIHQNTCYSQWLKSILVLSHG